MVGETLAIEDGKDDCIATAIGIARSQAIESGEPCTISVCICPAGVGPCDFCELIIVDENGKVTREVMQ